VLVYSLCRVPSRVCSEVCGKSLIFENRADAGPFEELLANGDVESVYRILKALQQKGGIDIIESEEEIYVSAHHSVSAGKRRKITRGLLVSEYDPVEDFRNLSALSRPHPGALAMDAGRNIRVSRYEPASATHHEGKKDDLFASDYDITELLESLTAKPDSPLAVQTAS
jgi:hypothetical protein